MPLSLVDVAGANFRTDDESDQLTTEFMSYLGVTKRLLPARLAVARSLAVPTAPPEIPDKAEQGKVIKGDALFGTGAHLGTWTALVVERSGASDVDLRFLMDQVARHWRRGISLLHDDWKASDEGHTRFIRRLVEVSGLKPDGGGHDAGGSEFSVTEYGGEIVLPIGEVSLDTANGERISWTMNGPGGSPHVAIMGGVGSGKTRSAVAILRALREQIQVPCLVFDFKGDLGETPDQSSSYRVDRLCHGMTIRPPETPVPLDVLALSGRTEVDINFAAQRFLDSFSRLKGSGVGAKQSSAVYEAASRALRSNNVCKLTDILVSLRAVYADRGLSEDGATATMEEICRFPLFEPTMNSNDFFSRSWVISLPANLPDRSRAIIVNLVLDALDRHLNSLPESRVDEHGNRSLRVLCVIDEAHRILSTKVPGLSSLIRQSRSKGGGVMLISQSPDDFAGEDDDFLAEMGLVIAFSTNARPNQVVRLIGKGVNLANLPAGECIVKRRGEGAAKRVRAWAREKISA
jgi:DNA sulfur modification protein DndE